MININTNIIYADMPTTIKAYTMHCNDDTYTIVLNSRHCLEQLMKSYHHEMKHIENGDYDNQCNDVQLIEIFAHEEQGIYLWIKILNGT